MNNELQRKIDELHTWRETIILSKQRDFETATNVASIDDVLSYLAYIKDGSEGIPDEEEFYFHVDKLLADLETAHGGNS